MENLKTYTDFNEGKQAYSDRNSEAYFLGSEDFQEGFEDAFHSDHPEYIAMEGNWPEEMFEGYTNMLWNELTDSQRKTITQYRDAQNAREQEADHLEMVKDIAARNTAWQIAFLAIGGLIGYLFAIGGMTR